MKDPLFRSAVLLNTIGWTLVAWTILVVAAWLTYALQGRGPLAEPAVVGRIAAPFAVTLVVAALASWFAARRAVRRHALGPLVDVGWGLTFIWNPVGVCLVVLWAMLMVLRLLGAMALGGWEMVQMVGRGCSLKERPYD